VHLHSKALEIYVVVIYTGTLTKLIHVKSNLGNHEMRWKMNVKQLSSRGLTEEYHGYVICTAIIATKFESIKY
jgi:hypothetical protein